MEISFVLSITIVALLCVCYIGYDYIIKFKHADITIFIFMVCLVIAFITLSTGGN